MRSEKSSDGWSVERCEAQAVIAVATDEPSDECAAEAAVAIVDDKEAVAELIAYFDWTGLVQEVHLPRRMRAGAGSMQT